MLQSVGVNHIDGIPLSGQSSHGPRAFLSGFCSDVSRSCAHPVHRFIGGRPAHELAVSEAMPHANSHDALMV
jgi:hypothetical protein